MSNQMVMPKINLLKLPDPAAQTAKYANMMNVARQQEAAERQAAQAQQQMDYATAEEGRRKQLHGPALTKAQQDNAVQALEMFRNAVGDIAEGDVAAAEAVRADLVNRIPGYDKFIPPASQWTRDTIERLMMDSEKEIDKLYATPVASTAINDRTGEMTSITAGGRRPRAETIYEAEPTPAPAGAAPRAPVASAPAAAPAGAPMRATRGSNTTPQDLMQQGMDPRNIPSGMPTSPASFNRGSMATPTAGQMSPDMVPAILDSAINTGVMAQIDLDQMLALAPPPARQGIMDVIRNNNINLQANAPSLAASGMAQQQPMAPNPVQRPQAQFADMRGPVPQSQTAGLDGAPPMQNTMAQSQGRTPFIARREAQAPAETPQQAGMRARATRPSAGELYDAEAAKIKAARDAGPAPLTSQQKTKRKTEVAKAYTQTQGLIAKTYDPKEGVIALARKIKSLSPDQKEAITGFSGYVPSFRESSREADTLFGNLKGVVTAAGKDAAAASGTIGPMAVQEWKIVADQIANLDLAGMTPRALDAQMDRIIRQVSNATNLAQQVYDVQFGDDIKEYPSFKLRGIPPAKAKTPVTKAPPGVSATEWKAMTPAERKLWQ